MARPLTDFDPVQLGRYECDAWVGYYRRDWRLVLRSVHGMVRVGFRLGRVGTLRCGWLVLRANQAWAPYPVNDAARAVALMERFYELVAGAHDLPIDPRRAALLEVDWWREHRFVQRGTPDSAGMPGSGATQTGGVPERRPDDEALVEALTRLYAYVYAADDADVRPAARLRAEAMHLSDAWVGRGCDLDDPALRQQRRLLVGSYTALRTAVEPAPVAR
jgi:hypothetical protein